MGRLGTGATHISDAHIVRLTALRDLSDLMRLVHVVARHLIGSDRLVGLALLHQHVDLS